MFLEGFGGDRAPPFFNGIVFRLHVCKSVGSWKFFLPGPIWGRTLFCIDIRNMVHLHMVKIHLSHIYMFELHCKENKHMNLLYNTPELFNTFGIIRDPLKPFASNSLCPLQLLQRQFLLFVVVLTAEHLEFSAPSRESYTVFNFLTTFVTRPIMVVKLNKNYLE